jgi:predicted nuclease with TOPRIM domain
MTIDTERRIRFILFLLILLLPPMAAEAQVKRLDCAPPRGVSRANEVATLISDAEADCSRGTEMLDQSKRWRATSNDLRKQSDRFRKEASKLRKEAGKLRDQVVDLRRRMEELREEASRVEDERESLDQQIAMREQVAGAFRGSNDSTISIPLPGSGQWEDGEDRYARAKIRFYEVRQNAIDDEIMTTEGMIQVNEELAADKEASAVDLDQLALNNERAALEAEASASLAEETAVLAERLAIMHNLKACKQYIALKLNDSGARRNVGRAVNYIEKHDLLLTGLDAAEASQIVEEAKIRFDL